MNLGWGGQLDLVGFIRSQGFLCEVRWPYGYQVLSVAQGGGGLGFTDGNWLKRESLEKERRME